MLTHLVTATQFTSDTSRIRSFGMTVEQKAFTETQQGRPE